MRITRNAAMRALNGFATLDRGVDGKPFSFDFPTLVHIATVERKLRAAVEVYVEVRNKLVSDLQSQKTSASTEQYADMEKEFLMKDREILAEEISIKMPKKKLKQGELVAAKVPPVTLEEIYPFVEWDDCEMDEDEDQF